jgi:hypothetical protein
MRPEIVVIGFPKCATSALIRCYENDPCIQLLRTPEGQLEVAWPLIRDIRPHPKPGCMLVHKWTAYVYSRTAVEYLLEVNPDSLLVLCVRDPARALLSWHNMHRNIARSGRNKSHFAWQERDFYAEAELSAYYERFARRALQYDSFLGSLLEVVPSQRLVVVSQERMALGIDLVATYLKALARGEAATVPSVPLGSSSKHKDYAENADALTDKHIIIELASVKARLEALVAEKVYYKCILN